MADRSAGIRNAAECGMLNSDQGPRDATVSAPPLAQTSSVRFGGSEPTSDLTASQRAFADAFVPAIAGRDPSRYTRLIHPASLACRTKENDQVFQEHLTRRQGLAGRRAPQVTIQELPAQLELLDYMAKNGYQYPVRPKVPRREGRRSRVGETSRRGATSRDALNQRSSPRRRSWCHSRRFGLRSCSRR